MLGAVKEPTESAGQDQDGARRQRVILAWVLVAAFAALVLWLGSARFDAEGTEGLLSPLLRFLFPDLSHSERYLLHVKVRKTAHAVEYGLLALLALRAAFLTFHTATARVASLALALAVVVATADETRQAFLPERTGSMADVLLDSAGAFAAIALALLIRRGTRRRRSADTPS
jgi:VanZ family protein